MSARRLEPAPRVAAVETYHVARHPAPIELWLDGNEGRRPPAELVDLLATIEPERLRLYPDPHPLEARLAALHGVERERVVVTAGADEALDRLFRACLAPDRELVLPVPTFVMIPRYARLAEGPIVEVPWESGPYPTDEVLARVTERTAIVAVVSPNNPTGLVASREDVARLARAVEPALCLLDHAYVEFADEELTGLVAEHPNLVVLRTFSKALGLAGLRVGYAVGPPDVVAWIRAAGGPYSVSTLSLLLASAALQVDPRGAATFVARVRRERDELAELLVDLGASVLPSQANFVCARFADERWIQEALAGLGVAVRRFPDERGMEGRLRITCPGDPADFARLTRALRAAARPDVVLFAPGASSLASIARTRGLRGPAWVAVEDAASPEALTEALRATGTEHGILLATEEAELAAARSARVVPLCVVPPGTDEEERHARLAAGAARCLSTTDELLEVLP